MQDVEFEKARLQGANLQEAQLQGASLDLSELDSLVASIGYVHLISSMLSVFSDPELQVEDQQLKVTEYYQKFGREWGPDFRDANLRSAQLQGADLRFARLQGADLGFAQLQGTNLESAQLQGVNLQSSQLQGADLRFARLQGADLGFAQLQGTNLESAQLQGANLRHAELQCTDIQKAQLQGADFGLARLQGAALGNKKLQDNSDIHGSWHLVWTPSVSYDFPADKSSYLKTLASDETATVKLTWEPGMSLEEHLQKCMEKDQGPRVRLPDNRNQPDWDIWAEWTAEFACKNEYTARSSLKRWASEEPLSGLEGSERDEAKKLILEDLAAARKTREKCPGLHSIPDDEWKEFISG